jgi:DNA-binding CsgD family transcriptional regulator
VSDPIGILETAYVLGGDERHWLRQLLETARRDNAEHGDWIAGCTYDATHASSIAVRANVYCGVDEASAAAAIAQVALPKSEDPKLATLFRQLFVGTIRASSGALRSAGVSDPLIRDFERRVDHSFRLLGLADELWVNAQDLTGIGCLLVAPRRRLGPLPPREVHRWRYVAAHLSAAFRIRRQLETWTPGAPANEMRRVEAILSPSGRLAHAAPPAQAQPARAALRRAVKAVDRARGSLRRRNPDEAIATWQAMVSGRWSLVDHFDSDGRRYVLAHRNDPQLPDARGLTPRERQVIAYAALGHSNKVIAYELGLSTPTVASHLARARAKLALPSAAALRKGAGGATGEPVPDRGTSGAARVE